MARIDDFGVMQFDLGETTAAFDIVDLNSLDFRGINNKNLTDDDRALLLARNFELVVNGTTWVKRGTCFTLKCIETRWNSDTTGYCRPCKIARGMIHPTSGVKKAIPADERTGTLIVTANAQVNFKIEKNFTSALNELNLTEARNLIRDAFNKMNFNQKKDFLLKMILGE